MLFRDMPTTYVHFQCSVGPAFFLIFLSEFKVPSLLASSLSPPPHSTSLSLSLQINFSKLGLHFLLFPRQIFFLSCFPSLDARMDGHYIYTVLCPSPTQPAETEEQEKASTAYLYLLACIFCCASTYLQKLCDERGGEAACCRPAVRAVYLAGC